MDKQATRILLGCILCTVIVFLLFLVAIRFNQLSCELVRIEPVHLRVAQLQAFNKSKPIRSHDKTMLMKISAYLEYNVPTVTSSSSSSSSNVQLATPQTLNASSSLANNNNLNQATNSQQLVQPIQSSIGSPSSRLAAPAPSVSQFNVLQSNGGGSNTAGSIPTQSQATGATAVTTSLPQHQPAIGGSITIQTNGNQSGAASNQPTVSSTNNQLRDEKRFLPLDLDEIQTRKLDDGKFKYSLTFNCSTLNMIVIRQAQRVYIESMNLELEPTSQKKSTCDILLPSPIPINTGGQLVTSSVHQHDTIQVMGQDDGIAHYHCRSPMVYNCFHFQNQKPPVVTTESAFNSGANPTTASSSPIQQKFGNSQLNAYSLQHGGLLVAVLHINAIEFETILLNSSQHFRYGTFKSKAKDCEQNPNPIPTPAQI